MSAFAFKRFVQMFALAVTLVVAGANESFAQDIGDGGFDSLFQNPGGVEINPEGVL